MVRRVILVPDRVIDTVRGESLRDRAVVVNGERIVAEEKLLTDLKQRIRDVRQAPDGSIYVLAGNSLLRLTSKK